MLPTLITFTQTVTQSNSLNSFFADAYEMRSNSVDVVNFNFDLTLLNFNDCVAFNYYLYFLAEGSHLCLTFSNIPAHSCDFSNVLVWLSSNPTILVALIPSVSQQTLSPPHFLFQPTSLCRAQLPMHCCIQCGSGHVPPHFPL